MKKLFALMVLGLSLIQAEAQTISQTFNDVSLSEVLRTLNDATSRYDVNFIYNELEDFRVSTSIQNQTVPDAVRQVVGFYPMRVSVADSLITVECTHKTDSHLRGRLVDETGEPVVYATVALYTPCAKRSMRERYGWNRNLLNCKERPSPLSDRNLFKARMARLSLMCRAHH